MRNTNTKHMLDYWMELFGRINGPDAAVGQLKWPERSDIQPSACRDLLGDMFILDLDGPVPSYRLAGTRLCTLLGRELKQEPFADTFHGPDQRAAGNWASALGRDDFLVLICCDAIDRIGHVTQTETLLMPLSHHGKANCRALGLTVPLSHSDWVGNRSIVEQRIRSVRIIRPWEDNSFLNDRVLENTDPQQGHQPLSFSDFSKAPIAPNLPDNVTSSETSVPYLRVFDGGKQ